jgi:sigma-B regulation protein RsbU (phosphoserine phosphatase)
MKHDLMLASKIQLDLLPKCIPSIPGYEIAGSTIPAKTVGGDYYDFIQLDNYNWVLCIGDVTGKGLPASLLMANLQATIRGQTFKSTSPKECLTRANNLLFHSTDTDKFATLFYSKLNTQDHLITFSNAGHDMPLHFCTDCTIKRFETGGFMLGAFEDLEFDEETVSVSSGDTIVMYSDGITEAINPEEEFYGQRRLEQLVAEHKSFSAKELHDSILESVHMHTRGHPQSDDLTLIVLKRT